MRIFLATYINQSHNIIISQYINISQPYQSDIYICPSSHNNYISTHQVKQVTHSLLYHHLSAMSQQIQQQSLPYSILTQMYRNWEEYSIPAVYYHYLLSVLQKKQKKQQLQIMSKEIKSLKTNTHPYHCIINAIQARQKSLSIIKNYIHIFIKYQNHSEMQWTTNTIELQFNNQSTINNKITDNQYSKSKQDKYNIIHEDQRSPILSPPKSISNKQKQQKLQELINHIHLYRKVTAQIIYMISQWENQIRLYGYQQSVIHFQYHKQDYLHIINNDISTILDQYQHLFQNNPFFILKKIHQKTQYALIYRNLKLSAEMNKKIQQCCNIIANHQAEILRFRMLAKVGQTSNKRRIITKSTDIHKIYNNFNNGKDYIVVRDTDIMKKSKINVQPILTRAKNYQNHFNIDEQIINANQRIKQFKNSIVINPEARNPYINKTAKKHPVKAQLLNLINNNKRGIVEQEVYLKTPKQLQQIQVRRNKSEKQDNIQGPQLKRSLTQRQIDMRRYSLANSEEKPKYDYQSTKALSTKYGEKISVKPIHGKNNIMVANKDTNNREDELNRNMGLSTHRKVDMIDQLNSQLKNKVRSLSQVIQHSKRQQRTRPVFDEPPSPLKSSRVVSQLSNSPQQQKTQNKQRLDGEQSIQNQISLTFQQSIKSTEIVKYLRAKVFNNSPQVTFQQIQTIAKRILSEKDLITFIRVQSGDMKLAWLAVKFIEKDQTMRRCVYIVYVRKFIKLTNFQRKLLDNFVEHGYGLIRNQQKILYEIDILDVITKPLIKIKYKINQRIQKKQIKQVVKKYPTIAQTRILKYHYYSKDSKYHSYCQHQKSYCMISFNFLQVCKISVDGKSYIRAKADRITRLDQNVYRIRCVVNQTDLIIANTMTDILQLQKQTQMEKDSSFDSNCQTRYKYIAIRQGKIMKKYVNDADQVVISQFVTVNGQIPEVRSIAMNKLEVNQNTLLLDPPYFMAIMTQDPGQAKNLVVLEFQ